MTAHPLPLFVQRFFTERLESQLGASPNTVASYRDTFMLLLLFTCSGLDRQPTDLLLTDIDAELIGRFLGSLESGRGNSARSRNTRLTAIRSFFKFVSLTEPRLLHHCQEVLAMPAKRCEKRTVEYLDRDEIEALLAAPDLATWYGRRDRALLLLCVQTGLRVSELIGLDCGDVDLGQGAHVACRATVTVTSSSGFVLRKVFYTVPSTLIGHRLKGRIYDDRLELWLGASPILTLPRGRPPARGRGGHAHVVNYHHVIHSLRTKPQALAGLRYRDQLFPRTAYRRCWDALSAALDQRSACTIMVGLLWLAHDRACEAELAQQLDELLAADRLPDLKLLEQRFVAHLNDVPVVTVDIPGADSYDALFAARELAA